MKKIFICLLATVAMLFAISSCVSDDDGSTHQHSYVKGVCSCGAKDPDYVAPHEHSFIDGKCSCGAEDPDYIPPHEHTFVDGKCSGCAITDPDYVPDYGSATVMGTWDQISIFVPGSDAMVHSEPLQKKLEEWTGKPVNFLNEFAYPTPHDIVVGYFADREISVKAYAHLEAMEKESYFDGRYLIYAEGGEIAIAYDENEASNLSALDFAVEYFIETFIEGKEYIAFAAGVVCSDNVDLIAEQEFLDEVTVANAWKKLAEVASPEIISALKKYYSLYTDSLVDWLANLYAPGKMDVEGGNWAGGFYGAPSGRDTAGFGPDITCTRQVLGLMESTGALNLIDGGYGANLPAKIRAEIVYMLKSLQDPTDGFFYHPQYDKETMLGLGDLQRRGRDNSAAIDLFDNLNALPTYTTPTGMSGDGITADEFLEIEYGSADFIRTVSRELGTSKKSAVASAILASDTVLASSITDNMFKSHDGFAAYLDTVKINEESYVWGNTLNAIISQIRAESSKLGECTDPSNPWYGKTLVDMLFDFLDARIDPTTGMWEPVTTFRATNGFYKIISVYNACKRSFAEPQIAAEGLIAGLLGDQVSRGNICDVYNIWIGLSDLKSNVKNYSDLPKEERDAVIKYIDDALARDGAAAILNSYDKYLPYRYDDGSFSDNVGAAAANHNGLPVGLGLAEGDTNATSIAVGVVGRIYSCYGWEKYKVPLYTESDWMRFINIILSLDPVMKYSYLSDDIEQNFDSIEDGELQSVNNILYTTGGVAKATVKTEGDNSYVEFNKFDVDNSGRIVVSGSRAMSSVRTATIEFKMNVLESNSGRISVVVGKYNRDLSLQTIYFGKSNSGNVQYESVAGWANTGAALGEWFNVKIVYFEGNGEQPLEFRVYINGVLMDIRYATTKSVKARDVGAFTLVPLYAWEGTLLYDDVKITRNNDMPVAGETPLYTPIVIPDYDYAVEDGVHTFDKLADGVIPSGCNEELFAFSNGGVSEANIVTEGENKYFYFNKILKQNSGSAKFRFAGATEGTANVVTVTARVLIESGNNGLISFNMTNSGGDGLKAVYLSVVGDKIAYGGNRATMTSAKVGEWMDLKIVYYEGSGKDNLYIGVYVNEALVGAMTAADRDLTAEKISAVSFVPLYDFLGKIRLDDVNLIRSNESFKLEDLPKPEIPEAPVNPDAPDAPDVPVVDFDYSTVNGIHTFEPAELGEIPDGALTGDIAFKSNGVANALIVTDETGKCLKFNKTDKDNSGSVSFFFDAHEDADIFHLGFSAKIASGSNSGNIGFNLLPEDSSKYLSRIFFKVDGKQIQYNKSGEWIDVVGVGVDQWFYVDAVYCEGNEDGEGAYLEIYVNGILYDTRTSFDNYYKAESITKIQLIPLYAFIGTVYIDVVRLEYGNGYIPGEIETPSKPPKPLPSFKTEDGVHTFGSAELGEIPSGYSDAFVTYSSGGVSSAQVVTDGENKILAFTKTETTTSGSIGFMFPAVESGTASYFRMNMRMKVKNGASGGEIAFTLSDASTSKYLSRPLLRADGKQIQYSNGGWNNVLYANTDEWLDITVIYYEGASDTDNTGAYLTLYVNGILCYTTESFSNAHTAEAIRRVVLVPLMRFKGTVYIDDISLVHSAEAPEEPVAPPHEHSFVEGKCECGAADPSYVPPHEHSYVDGKCECGAADPDYKPAIVIPEADDNADITFAQMPETSLISLATNNVAEYSLVDLVTDKNGISHEGVLHYNKTASGANSSIIFGLTSYAEGAEKIVFTADYMAGAAGSGGLEFYVGGKFVFEASGISAAEEWSKLTVIITPEGEGIAVELYVNGVMKKSGAVAVSFDAANKMTVRWWKSSVAGMYLDNVSFKQIAKEEEPAV